MPKTQLRVPTTAGKKLGERHPCLQLGSQALHLLCSKPYVKARYDAPVTTCSQLQQQPRPLAGACSSCSSDRDGPSCGSARRRAPPTVSAQAEPGAKLARKEAGTGSVHASSCKTLRFGAGFSPRDPPKKTWPRGSCHLSMPEVDSFQTPTEVLAPSRQGTKKNREVSAGEAIFAWRKAWGGAMSAEDRYGRPQSSPRLRPVRKLYGTWVA